MRSTDDHHIAVWERRRFARAAFDLGNAALFWTVWSHPLGLPPSWIDSLTLTFGLEFFALFFGYFLCAFVLHGPRVLRLVGSLLVAAAYLTAVSGLLRTGGGLLAFLPLLLQLGAHLQAAWVADSERQIRAMERALDIGFGLPLWLILLVVGQEAARPWGIDAEALTRAGLPADAQPWRNLCGGALYYSAMALWRGPAAIALGRWAPRFSRIFLPSRSP